MKFFRKRFVVRVWALTTALLIVQSVVIPQDAFATVGPNQPEYTSYEEPGATDLVNLTTGDFTYSIPLLDVPSPEGSFSLPLSYHAGIGTQQDASWVGLGWNLNAGAILRSFNGFPDDANGEGQSVTVQDLTGLRGWTANTLIAGKFGWNSNQGHFGALSLGPLSAEWREGYTSVGIGGVQMTSDGIKVDAVKLVMTGLEIASGGFSSLAKVGKTVAIGASMSAGAASVGAMFGRNSPSAPGGYWAYSKKEFDIFFYHKYRIWLDKTRVEKMYGQLYLGNAPVDPVTAPGGGAVPAMKNGGASETLFQYRNSSNVGVASDINSTPADNEQNLDYRELNNPVFLAPDHFSVQGSGISGGIKPYRLEIAAASMPREMTSMHQRMAPVRYLANNETYKVPFIYDGQSSSAYYHHVGGATSITSPTFYYGLSSAISGSGQGTITYELNDVALKNQRIRTDLATLKKIPSANYVEWLSNGEIRDAVTYSSGYMDYFNGGAGPGVSMASERYGYRSYMPVGYTTVFTSTSSLQSTAPDKTIVPISVDDIAKFVIDDVVDLEISVYASQADFNSGKTSSIISVGSAIVRGKGSSSIEFTDSRLVPHWNKIMNIEIVVHKSQQTTSSIGGFCVTGPDGTTYHFGLPVYEYDFKTEVHEKTDHNKRSVTQRLSPFANAWLLTGITGADFYDRNSNGIIDETDWGYWVKFNYGKHLDDYAWRIPHSGWSNLEGDNTETYTQGKNQLIYLNSIETRSHVALFSKSGRTDGKSSTGSQAPLRLDDIYLITRDHYKKLIKPVVENGYAMADFSNKLSPVLNDGLLSGAPLTFIKQNCLKRIHFTYSYDLAQGGPNATSGKLTLTRVGVIGRNDAPVMPDYKFQYGYNPVASANDYDGWGLYNPDGDVGYLTHYVSLYPQQGAAWSLTGITTPLGGQISVAYERDNYASISGYDTEEMPCTYGNTNANLTVGSPEISRLYIANADAMFVAGDEVRLKGETSFGCLGSENRRTVHTVAETFTVAFVGSNYIDLGVDFENFALATNCGSTSSTPIEVFLQKGNIYKTIPNKFGGNLRVGSITVGNDYGVSKKIRYLYQNEDGTSSGVVSQEPASIPSNYYFSELPGYPQTPVMYARTVILNGKLSTDSDFTSKDVYEFETPHHSLYALTRNVVQGRTEVHSWSNAGQTYKDYMTKFENKVEDRTSKIGKVKTIKHYDGQGTLISSSTMTYTDQLLNGGANNYQGTYTSGTMMVERLVAGSIIDHKMNRTTAIQYPYALKKTVHNKDGFSNETEYKSWDFLTGGVIEKIEKSRQGIYLKTVTKPAYTVYGEMGDKTTDVTRKNMLMAQAATYVYRVDANGNTLGLVGANATTWKKNWTNYRVYNTGTQTFSDNTDGPQFWRMSGNYYYKGSYLSLRSDGTRAFTSANDLNFDDPGASTAWQYVGEIYRYDHFSTPLEAKDKDNIYSSTKFGYDERFKIAEAANAMYTEMAFSSAEDPRSDIPFFGGEVAKGNGAVVRKSLGEVTEVHTGDAALSLTSGYGFVYKPSSITPNRTYRISVWTNSTNGRVYYKLNGGGEMLSPAPTDATKAGIWYRINFEIPVASFTSLEVGVKNASPVAAMLFDDFRFQPVDAGMLAFVVTPPDQAFTSDESNYEYVLDNENLFTKYEYSKRGLLIKTYQETFGFGPKLVSEHKDNYKRFYVNQ